ncbi:46040_t:CDS:2 [Gigaspora margarita]|uniref:46040_t:CDS:1 n=1 Tax=Gigaspora margarita TaxID=4874 RepID=A0ABM8VW89_GIGMA|nr:46040_t:CDS:2 [Gigaspora margarita]
MSCSEFTYLNFEKYEFFKESSKEEIFKIGRIALAKAQALLNNNAEYDENYNIDWNEIEVENSDLYDELLSTMHDKPDIVIEISSIQSSNLIPCIIIDITDEIIYALIRLIVFSFSISAPKFI